MKQERFRTGLLQQAEEFKKQAADLLREFENNGPFTSNIKTDDALANIEAVRAQMEALKEQEQTIRRGLNIFKIDQPPSKDIGTLEKVLKILFFGTKLCATGLKCICKGETVEEDLC